MVRGYVFGSCIGMTVGVAIALWRPVRLTIEPTFDILRTIRATSIIPPLIAIFGLGDPRKLFCISFAVVCPVALNTISGVVSIDPIYMLVAPDPGFSADNREAENPPRSTWGCANPGNRGSWVL